MHKMIIGCCITFVVVIILYYGFKNLNHKHTPPTPTPTPPPTPGGIVNSIGSSLKNNTVMNIKTNFLQSENKQYVATFNENDFIIIDTFSHPSTIFKTSITSPSGSSASFLKMQTDGNLVLYISSSFTDSVWNSGPPFFGNGIQLNLQDNGMICLYDTINGTNIKCFNLSIPNPPPIPKLINNLGNQLVPGQSMIAGKDYLESLDSSYIATFCGNNIVLINGPNIIMTNIIGTVNDVATSLTMQNDGNLVMYSKTNKPLWNSKTRTLLSAVKLDGGDNPGLYLNTSRL